MKHVHNHPLKRFKILSTLFCLVSLSGLFAQQDVQYTQYMYNTGTINPAYVGSQEVLQATLLYRNQWLGIEGAPRTLNFTINKQLGKRTGGGLTFITDNIGPSKESTVALDFSYNIPMGNDFQLALGIKGGVNLLNVDYSLLTIFDNTDPNAQQNIDNRLSPVIGTGIYAFNDKFYVGVSVPNLLRTTHYDDITESTARERPNFYFITGYVFNLSDTWLFKPATLIKAVENAPLAFDISANFLYNEKFTIGAAYRLDVAVSALAGFQVSDAIQIGYAYDYSTSNLGNFNSGSHEVFMRFSLGNKTDDRLIEPRFF